MTGCPHTGGRTEISRRTEGSGANASVVVLYRCHDCQGTYEEYV